MRLFGINLVKDTDLERLEEAEVNLGLAKREMEDLGYRLLNPQGDPQSSDLTALDRRKASKRGIDYWVKDPVVGQSVDMLTDYVIGRGIEMPQTQHDKLREIIARFWNDEDNQRIITSAEAQRQKLAELQIMGNVFPAAFVNEANGHVKLSDLPPNEVTEIISHPENRKRHIYYRRNWSEMKYNFADGSWEAGEVKTVYYKSAHLDEPIAGYQPPALEEAVVFHWAVNRLSDGKFGNPRILRILDWVHAYNEFMKARVSLMRALAMFAWRRKVKGNASDVRRIANAWTSGQLAGSASEGSGLAGIPAQYAATVTTNENVSWDQLKTDTGGGAAREDGRMIKGQIGMGAGWPLHYLGDIGGANLATATAMELPVLKMIESMQGYIEECLREIIDFAIVQAIKAGELKPAPSGRFSAERIKVANEGVGTMSEADPETPEGESDKKLGEGDRSIYDYKVVMPAILKRQVSEQVNAAVNMLKAVDPYSQNVDASRWALRFALEIMDEPNPQAIVDVIFPPGYEYPTNVEVERGRSDTREGDGRGQVDFTANRKPPAESRVGAKGGKEARQPGEIDTSVAEAALLDVIDRAMDRMEEADGGDDTGTGAAAASEQG